MDVLQHNHDVLCAQFRDARHDVAAIVDTIQTDVLPQLVLDLALSDTDIAWLSEWLGDTASIFRLLRRHRFIRPLVLEEIRSIAIWRLQILRPVLLLPAPTLFRRLAPSVTDPLGRPILLLRLASLSIPPCSVKDALLQEAECLRLHIRCSGDSDAHTDSIPLQYVLLIDLGGASIQYYNLDLCSWMLTDIVPRYPGMLAAVFVLNYSWTHSSVWSVAKRFLPLSTIARVFFPSRTQLLDYFSPEALPAEYGGSLPSIDRIDDTLHWARHRPPPPLLAERTISPNPPSPPSSSQPTHRARSTIDLAPFSPQNPYYGYPVVASASSPHKVRHVQRGMRDLVRTLAVLWWRRWGRWVSFAAYASLCASAVLLVRRVRTRTTAKTTETSMNMGIGAMDVVKATIAMTRA